MPLCGRIRDDENRRQRARERVAHAQTDDRRGEREDENRFDFPRAWERQDQMHERRGPQRQLDSGAEEMLLLNQEFGQCDAQHCYEDVHGEEK